jgi:hypothetical protein
MKFHALKKTFFLYYLYTTNFFWEPKYRDWAGNLIFKYSLVKDGEIDLNLIEIWWIDKKASDRPIVTYRLNLNKMKKIKKNHGSCLSSRQQRKIQFTEGGRKYMGPPFLPVYTVYTVGRGGKAKRENRGRPGGAGLAAGPTWCCLFWCVCVSWLSSAWRLKQNK